MPHSDNSCQANLLTGIVNNVVDGVELDDAKLRYESIFFGHGLWYILFSGPVWGASNLVLSCQRYNYQILLIYAIYNSYISRFSPVDMLVLIAEILFFAQKTGIEYILNFNSL